jgi:hypothetical protein
MKVFPEELLEVLQFDQLVMFLSIAMLFVFISLFLKISVRERHARIGED